MHNENIFVLPDPILDLKELDALDTLTNRYDKLIAPKKSAEIAAKISDKVPAQMKDFVQGLSESITEQELYTRVMEIATDGFKVLEQNTAKYTISQESIVKKINSVVPNYNITKLEDICLARSYELAKIINKDKTKELSMAFVEGGALGYFGFAGVPFNLALSIFLYYRAVQAVAMHYGYDVKNDPAEMIIAGEVFSKAMNPHGAANSEVSDIVAKIMVISKGDAIKKTVDKGWVAMAERGGVELLLTQLRAMANASAQKALNKAGQKGLEAGIFKDLCEQIGKKLTQKSIKKAIPYISAAIGALMDTSQMNKILEYADVFYQKRFILEKSKRLEMLSEKYTTVEIMVTE